MTMISPNSDIFFGVENPPVNFLFFPSQVRVSAWRMQLGTPGPELPDRMSDRSKVRIFMLRILPDDMSETMSEFSGVRVGSTRSFFPRLV